jgi:hypothetical protein
LKRKWSKKFSKRNEAKKLSESKRKHAKKISPLFSIMHAKTKGNGSRFASKRNFFFRETGAHPNSEHYLKDTQNRTKRL